MLRLRNQNRNRNRQNRRNQYRQQPDNINNDEENEEEFEVERVSGIRRNDAGEVFISWNINNYFVMNCYTKYLNASDIYLLLSNVL